MKGNIIICGAPRAGTTSLYRYLSAHKQVVASTNKELNFFLGGSYLSDCFDEKRDSQKFYSELFPNLNDAQWSLEASPSYMHSCYLPQVAERIKNISPDAMLIFILRDPVERLYSEYKGRKNRQSQFSKDFYFKDFVDELMKGSSPVSYGVDVSSQHLVRDALLLGVYESVIRKYLMYFSPRQIKLVFMDELSETPKKVMQEISMWLNISPKVYSVYEFNVENQMVESKNNLLYRLALQLNNFLEPLLNRFPKVRVLLRNIHSAINVSKTKSSDGIDKQTREKLASYYAPSNHDLELLIKKDWPSTSMPAWVSYR